MLIMAPPKCFGIKEKSTEAEAGFLKDVYSNKTCSEFLPNTSKRSKTRLKVFWKALTINK